jgi:hypothetical protein
MVLVRSLKLALVASLVAASALVAQAADVLKHVPDSALAVVVINDLEKASEKVDEIAKKLQQSAPGALDKAIDKAGLDESVDRDGCAAVVLVGRKGAAGAPPGAIMLVPVDDYKKFLKELEVEGDGKIVKAEVANKEMAITKVGDYAAMTQASDEGLLEQVSDVKSSVADEVSANKSWLDEQDAYVLGTQAGISLASDQILAAMENAGKQFENLGDEKQAAAIKMAFGMYGDLFRGVKANVTQVAIGVRAGKGGLHIASRSLIKSGTDAAKLIGSIKPADTDVFAGLPAGKYAVLGGGVSNPELMTALQKWSGNVMTLIPGENKIEPQDVEEVIKLSRDSLSGLKSAAIALEVGEAGKPIYSNAVGILKVDDSARFLASYSKSMAAMNALAEKIKNPLVQSNTTKSVEVAGKPGLQITMKMEGLAGGQDPATGQLLKRLFGDGDTVDMYLAAVDKQTIAVGYVTEDAIGKVIEAGGKGTAITGDLSKTKALLPKGAQVVGFLDVKNVIDMVFANVPALEAFPPAGLVKEFPESPALGFGLKFAKDAIETDLVVPDETLEAVGQTIAKAQAAAALGRKISAIAPARLNAAAAAR